MTDAKWQGGANPVPMLDYLRDSRASDRKLRLFAVGGCRRIWPSITDPRSRLAVETSERFVGGSATAVELRAAQIAADAAADEAQGGGEVDAADAAADVGTDFRACAIAAADADYPNRQAEYLVQAGMLRDIFGPLPSHPVPVDPAWLTSTVVALARQVYESGDFTPMPVLADALQDAGCEREDILSHCRSDGRHVRGCWVVDLLLGKE